MVHAGVSEANIDNKIDPRDSMGDVEIYKESESNYEGNTIQVNLDCAITLVATEWVLIRNMSFHQARDGIPYIELDCLYIEVGASITQRYIMRLYDFVNNVDIWQGCCVDYMDDDKSGTINLLVPGRRGSD